MGVVLKNVTIDYGSMLAVKNLNLNIETGKLVSLLGPSGCGKSTTLFAIAGLIQISEGQIIFNGKDVTKRSPQNRNLGLVFQNYALYPHLTVFKNIAFPLYQDKKFKINIKVNNKLIRYQIKDLKKSKLDWNRITFKANVEAEIDDYLNNKSNEIKKLMNEKIDALIKEHKKFVRAHLDNEDLVLYKNNFYTKWINETKRDFQEAYVQSLVKIKSEFKLLYKKHQNYMKTLFDSNYKKPLLSDYAFAIHKCLNKFTIETINKEKAKLRTLNHVCNDHKNLEKQFNKVLTSLELSDEEKVNVRKLINDEENIIVDEQNKFKQIIDNDLLKDLSHEINKIDEEVKQLLDSNQFPVGEMFIDETEYKAKLQDLKNKIINFREKIKSTVMDVASKVEIADQLKKRPSELSGGQQQRVAIARAIVKEPDILLLDEPLSNLDAKLRVSTREWIRRFQNNLGITTIFVTHDQEEAMSISDEIYVMNKGVLQQFGSPSEIYSKPANRFVAEFIGTPSMNFFEGSIDNNGNVFLGDINVGRSNSYKGINITIGVRPEHIEVDVINDKNQYANNVPLQATVTLFEELGRSAFVEFSYQNNLVKSVYEMKKNYRFKINDPIRFNIVKNNIYLFAKDEQEKLLEVI